MELSPLYGLLIFALMLAALMGIGAAVSGLLGRRPEDGLFAPVSFALGSGLVSLVFFFLCAAGVFNPIALVAAEAAGLVLFVLNIKKLLAGFKAIDVGGNDSKLRRAVGAICVMFMGITMMLSLTPPVELDAVAYHLPLARLYAGAGGFVETPSIVYSYMPMGVQVLYAAAIAAGSTVAASLVCFAFGAFTAIGLWELGDRLSGGKNLAGPVAAALFLGTPLVAWEMRSAYVDTAFCMYLFAAFAILLESGGERVFRNTVAAGLCAGFAVAAKLVAGPYAVMLMVFCVVMQKVTPGRRVAVAAIFCAACVAPVLPWLIKTFIQTGNPVFPFGYSLLGGANWNPDVHREYINWHMGYGVGRSPLQFLLLPYTLTFGPGGVFGWPGSMPDREIGYGFFFLIPLLFVPGKMIKKQWPVAIYMIAGMVLWFFGNQQLRYLMAVMPAMCLLYSAKLVNLEKYRLYAAGLVVVVVLTVVNLYNFSQGAVGASGALAGVDERENYIRKKIPAYDVFVEADNFSMKEGGNKIGLILENRSLYSKLEPVWLNPHQQGVVNYSEIGTADELLDRLNELEVDYLAVNVSEFGRLLNVMKEKKNAGVEYSEYFYRYFTLFDAMFKKYGKEIVFTRRLREKRENGEFAVTGSYFLMRVPGRGENAEDREPGL